MYKSTLIFLFLSLFCVVIEGFFSMFEMAAMSLNKVRLAYYTSKNIKRAAWVDYLLKRPSRLVGTTLIIVNTVLQIGSEAARRFYESLGLNPNLAALSQAVLVIIFGELAPLFAARRHSESIALFNVPVVYFISRLLFPITWVLDKFSSFLNHLFFKANSQQFYLTKEEIQKAFEEKGKITKDIYINKTINNIFSLKKLKAKDLMINLTLARLVPSDFTLQQLKIFLNKEYSSYILIYHFNMTNVISVVLPKDLLKADAKDLVKNYGGSPWFVTENLSILEILQQFKRNNQSVAIILDDFGKAIGVITLDMIILQILGVETVKTESHFMLNKKMKKPVLIEKTLLGEMPVEEFNQKFKANLPEDEDTLSNLINSILGYHPSTGEVIFIEDFEFIIKEASILGTKKVLVRNLK